MGGWGLFFVFLGGGWLECEDDAHAVVGGFGVVCIGGEGQVGM